MEDLDTAHLYDRYQSALVAWHAESFGEGPQSEAGQAAIAAGALAGSTPKAKVGRRKDRRL